MRTLSSKPGTKAGTEFSLALSAGKVYAFGRNQYGKLGTGSSEGKGSKVPTAIEGIAPVTAIAAGNEGGLRCLNTEPQGQRHW